MKFPSRTLAAVSMAAAIPFLAGGTVAAAPLAQSLTLKNADVSVVQDVQYRRRGAWRGGRSGRWIGPAIGLGAGIAIGSALAPRYYYDDSAYAYAPGYSYAPRAYDGDYAYAPRYRSQFPAARCGDSDYASAYPSWACPPNPNATGW